MAGPVRLLYVGSSDGATQLRSELSKQAPEAGFVAVKTAAEARERLDAGGFDAVLSEADVPDGEGLPLLYDAIEQGASETVLFAGAAEPGVTRAALEAGVSEVLPGSGVEMAGVAVRRVLDRVSATPSAARRVDHVIREVEHALVRSSTREEIETAACEILAGNAAYVFAWIGTVDERIDVVRPRAWAGIEEGYLEEIVISTRKEPAGEGPTGRAVRSGEIQVVQDIMHDPAYEPWRASAKARGYRSSAAIPLIHEGVMHGVLNVYSARPHAFDRQEIALLQDLAAGIAYGIEHAGALTELERFGSLVERIPVGVYRATLGPDGHFLYANQAMAEILGYASAKDLEGDRIVDFYVDASDRERFSQRLEDEGRVEQEEIQIKTRQGERRWIEATTILSRHTGDEAGTEYEGIVRDITERKARERRIEQLKQQYETVFEHASDGLFLLSVEDEVRILRFNPAEEDLVGLTTEEVEGQSIQEALGDDLGQRLLENYQECIEAQEPIRYEEEINLPAGRRVFRTSIAPVIVDGDVTHLVGVAHDVTHQRAREDQLKIQRDQLELLNRLIRHDIRNDMTLVLGLADMLQDQAPEVLREDLARIEDTGKHTVELTQVARDLVEIIREGGQLETEPVPLRKPLETETENAKRRFPEARITLEADAADIEIQANQLVGAVVRNVLNNAVQHNDKETPTVDIHVEATDEEVIVSIADNGPGIPPKKRDQLFKRKEPTMSGEDTSMGLYLVHRLMHGYGGGVEVQDGEPEGAVVRLRFVNASA